MKNLIQITIATFLALIFANGFAQDHSQHQAAGNDHMAHLDADLEEIRKTEDPAKRKEMLLHHLQMMGEQIKTMAAMDHGAMMGGAEHNMQNMDKGSNESSAGKGPMGMGQEMNNMDHGAAGQGMDMMQHHQHMVKMMAHMLAMQELMLGLIDTK